MCSLVTPHFTVLFEKVLSLPETRDSAGLTGQPANPRDPPVYTSLALELQVPGTRQAAYENAGDYGADSHPCVSRNFPIELCPSPPGETFQSYPAKLQNPFSLSKGWLLFSGLYPHLFLVLASVALTSLCGDTHSCASL